MFLWNILENIIFAPFPPCEPRVKPIRATLCLRAFVAKQFVNSWLFSFKTPKNYFFSKKLLNIALEMIDKINPDLIASM